MDQLQAGPELDALIAERVMGWHRVEHPDALDPAFRYKWHDAANRFQREGYWSPSTEIFYAWEVFTCPIMVGQVLGWLVYDPRSRPDLTEVDDLGYAREYICTARGTPVVAPTAPLAICWATLAALDTHAS